MKCFKCVALDKEWKTCTGFVEAVSVEDAKEQVKKLGYSIVSINEYAGADVKALNVFESPGQADTKSEENEGALPSSKEVIHPLRFMLPMLLAFAVIGLAIFVYLNWFNQPAVTPDKVVIDYLELGRDKNWNEQYLLMTERMRSSFGSAGDYAAAMNQSWFGIVAPEKSEAEQYEGAPPKMFYMNMELAELDENTAQAGIEILSEGENTPFVFLLSREKGKWQIDYIRNVFMMYKRLNFLASQSDDEQTEKILFELRNQFGLGEDELDLLLNKAKIEYMQKLRQKALETKAILEKRKERAVREGVAQSSFEYEAVTEEVDAPAEPAFPIGDGGESDEVQNKLEEVLAMVEEGS